jgi:hypothetical protein
LRLPPGSPRFLSIASLVVQEIFVTPRYFSITFRWFALLAWPLASAAHAQATPAPPAFKSAFEGYQPYTDEKVVNWKEANENVSRIGGWRAYAKEAAGAAPAEPPATPVKTMPVPAAVKP